LCALQYNVFIAFLRCYSLYHLIALGADIVFFVEVTRPKINLVANPEFWYGERGGRRQRRRGGVWPTSSSK